MKDLLIILPFVLSLLVKLLNIELLPKVMLKELADLRNMPGTPEQKAAFGDDQRRLIVNTVANSGLKATTILTSISSAFAAYIVLSLSFSFGRLMWLAGASALMLILLARMLPQTPQELSEKGMFGVERATVIMLICCCFDGFGVLFSLIK